MIAKIAWRNIWRSPLRSFILLTSIVLGIWAGLFIISFSYGLNNQRVSEAINSSIGHVQIHHPKFAQEERVVNSLPEIQHIENVLKNNLEVHAFATRTVFNAMVQSAAAARGIRLLGVSPSAEKEVSNYYEKITQGSWFESDKKNQLVIGEKLAEKMHVKLGSKLVLTFQDHENNVVAARFTVGGLYKSVNSKMDELIVFTRKEAVFKLIGGDYQQEIILRATDFQQSEMLAKELANSLPDVEVVSWKNVAPELAYADEMLAISLMLVMGIIMLALLFGVLNNMLMAILERTRELGMLQAVGMNKPRIFAMIVLETIFLGLVGGPIGILLGWATVKLLGNVGIDLSIFGEGLESFGIATRVYPYIDGYFYGGVAAMVICMALIAAIYPAIKALKLNPVNAIRHT